MISFFRSQIQRKLILAFILVLLIPSGLITTYTLKTATDSLINSARKDELSSLRLKASATDKVLDAAKSGALFLSQSPTVTLYVEALDRGDASGEVPAVDQLFASFLHNSATLYKDLRILNKKGMEILRVDNTNGQPVITPAADLEDKAARPYYYETIKLKSGQVYISGFDLNVTRGKIDEPYLPVIRYAIPLYTQADNLVGVLVLKAFATQVLEAIQEGANTVQKNYLIDQDGSYLVGAELPKLYGRILKKDSSFFKDAPIDAAVFRSDAQGTLFDTQEQPGVLQGFVHIHPADQPAVDWFLVQQHLTADILGEVANARTLLSWLPSSRC